MRNFAEKNRAAGVGLERALNEMNIPAERRELGGAKSLINCTIDDTPDFFRRMVVGVLFRQRSIG